MADKDNVVQLETVFDRERRIQALREAARSLDCVVFERKDIEQFCARSTVPGIAWDQACDRGDEQRLRQHIYQSIGHQVGALAFQQGFVHCNEQWGDTRREFEARLWLVRGKGTVDG